MKIRFENTDLFETDLKNKLLNVIEKQMDDLLKDRNYKLHLGFNESVIRDYIRIENFEIPEESLPKYQQGIVLSNEDKLNAILSYQIHTVMKVVEENGIVLRHCDITGSPFVPISNMEFSLEEDSLRDEEIRTKKGNIKKIKMPKVIVIMPSLTGFAYNINNVVDKYEKQREDELIQAFGDKTLYEKYNAILGKSNLYEIYADFKKEYGDVWALSRAYGKLLKTKFLDTVNVKAGFITDEMEKKNVLQPIEMDLTLLFDIPVYKNIRKNFTSHKYIGHAKLLTNGRIVKVEYEANIKTYEIPKENFEKCFIEVESKDDNRKMVKKIRELVETSEKVCFEYGYALEKNLVDNVIAFMDIKNILKNAGKA